MSALLLGRALDYHRQGLLDEAAALYRALLERRPDHAEALRLLGLLCLQRGEAGEALALAGRRGGDPEAQAQRGEAFARLGRRDDAAAAWRAALVLDPAQPAVLLRLAAVLDPDCDAGLAIGLVRRAAGLDPLAAPAHIALGNALQGAGRFDEALVCYRRALVLDPVLVAAHENMGKALFAAGREAEAVAPFLLMAGVSPADPLPWTWLVGLYRALWLNPEAGRALARERELRGVGERLPRRSVVIPVLDYSPGSPHDIRTLLDDLAGFDGEVIVVFNDEAMFRDLACHPRIDKFAHNRHNVGVARAWNIGINHAEGDVVFVLNADLHLGLDVLARLEEYLLELPDAVMVAPGGDRINPAHFHATARWAAGTFAEPVEVDRVQGFLFALHAQRFHDAGLCFDPRMSPYFNEETDIGLKARAAGLKTWAVPVTGFEHVWGITRSDRRITYFGRPVDRSAMLVKNGLILRERVRRTGK